MQNLTNKQRKELNKKEKEEAAGLAPKNSKPTETAAAAPTSQVIVVKDMGSVAI